MENHPTKEEYISNHARDAVSPIYVHKSVREGQYYPLYVPTRDTTLVRQLPLSVYVGGDYIRGVSPAQSTVVSGEIQSCVWTVLISNSTLYIRRAYRGAVLGVGGSAGYMYVCRCYCWEIHRHCSASRYCIV